MQIQITGTRAFNLDNTIQTSIESLQCVPPYTVIETSTVVANGGTVQRGTVNNLQIVLESCCRIVR